MNIDKEQIDDLNIEVKVKLGKEDYEPKIDEVLRGYNRKANVPGFRPGKVPMGLLRKMYGKQVLIEEINKLVSQSLQDFINKEELKVLGDPMPKSSGEDLNWEIGEDFTFDFEMGLAPKIQINLSKDDKISEYSITVDQDMIDKEMDSYAARHGKFVEVNEVVDFKEKLTGDIVQLDENNQPLEGGFAAEDSSVILSLIKDEEHKKPFENAKIGDEIIFNLSETYPNEWEIASILQKQKEEIGNIKDSNFRFTVKKMEKYENAELDQELFDKVFGENAVKSKEEFEERIKERIAADFKEHSMMKFGMDARDYLLQKLQPALPEKFLNKWLWAVNRDKDISQEAFDKEFPLFLKGTQWDLIVQTIAKEKDIKIEEQDIIEAAKDATKRQFARYGISDFPDDMLNNYAMNTLKEESNVRQIISQLVERKALNAIHDEVSILDQEVSFEEFNRICDPEQEEEQEN